MSSDAPMLTGDLIEQVLDALARAGSCTRERLYPGLTDEQMDDLIAPLGLVLPTEGRVWWSHHNGGDDALLSSGRAVAVPAGTPSAISVVIPREAEDLRDNVLPSFGALVSIWIVALDGGLWEPRC